MFEINVLKKCPIMISAKKDVVTVSGLQTDEKFQNLLRMFSPVDVVAEKNDLPGVWAHLLNQEP
jgi:hypothetical protein